MDMEIGFYWLHKQRQTIAISIEYISIKSYGFSRYIGTYSLSSLREKRRKMSRHFARIILTKFRMY